MIRNVELANPVTYGAVTTSTIGADGLMIHVVPNLLLYGRESLEKGIFTYV